MRVLLDTCVLVPNPIRSILLRLAEQQIFIPIWSERIFTEWELVVSRNSSELAQVTRIEILLMKSKWKNSLVCNDTILEEKLMLPDRSDRHVLASAISGQAEILLTNNLKDFPSIVLSKYGITPRSSDSFFLELFYDNPDLIGSIVNQVFELNRGKTFKGSSIRSFLKKYGLFRLAKAIRS